MQLRPISAPTRGFRFALKRRSLPAALLAMLLCALWMQAQHLHAPTAADHVDCVACKIGNAEAITSAATAHILLTTQHPTPITRPLPARAARPLQVRNRAPPAFSPATI